MATASISSSSDVRARSKSPLRPDCSPGMRGALIFAQEFGCIGRIYTKELFRNKLSILLVLVRLYCVVVSRHSTAMPPSSALSSQTNPSHYAQFISCQFLRVIAWCHQACFILPIEHIAICQKSYCRQIFFSI